MLRLTRQQAREIDRRAEQRYHIPSIVLMENAARSALEVAGEMLDGRWERPVTLLCGGGNNGGDGLALARLLTLRGTPVQIRLTVDPQKYRGDALTNWRIAQAMGIDIAPVDLSLLRRSSAALLVDAVFGTGLLQAPRDPFRELVDTVVAGGRPVLALDVPSGLDCDTGLPFSDAIPAQRTITFAAEKMGFANPASVKFTGRVTVGGIGCPVDVPES